MSVHLKTWAPLPVFTDWLHPSPVSLSSNLVLAVWWCPWTGLLLESLGSWVLGWVESLRQWYSACCWAQLEPWVQRLPIGNWVNGHRLEAWGPRIHLGLWGLSGAGIYQEPGFPGACQEPSVMIGAGWCWGSWESTVTWCYTCQPTLALARNLGLLKLPEAKGVDRHWSESGAWVHRSPLGIWSQGSCLEIHWPLSHLGLQELAGTLICWEPEFIGAL